MNVMMNGMMAGMAVWAVVGLLALVAVLAVAVLGTVWLVRGTRRDHSLTPGVRDDDARELLRRRYATGEIDDQEYRHRLAGLIRR